MLALTAKRLEIRAADSGTVHAVTVEEVGEAHPDRVLTHRAGAEDGYRWRKHIAPHFGGWRLPRDHLETIMSGHPWMERGVAPPPTGSSSTP